MSERGLLLFEPNPANSQYVKDVLNAAGYTVTECHSEEDAIQTLEQSLPCPMLLIANIGIANRYHAIIAPKIDPSPWTQVIFLRAPEEIVNIPVPSYPSNYGFLPNNANPVEIQSMVAIALQGRGVSPSGDSTFSSVDHLNHAIFSSLFVGIVLCNSDLICQKWNPYMETFTGCAESKVIGRPMSELCHTSSAHTLEGSIRRTLRGEGGAVSEILFETRGAGATKWATCACSPRFGQDGSIDGVILFFQDMSEILSLRSQPQTSPPPFQALVEKGADVFYSVDHQGDVTYISPAIETIIGISAKDIIRRNLSDVFLQEKNPRFETGCSWMVPQRKSYHEFSFSHPIRGDVWLRISACPTTESNQNKGFQGVITDITAAKLLENQLRHAAEEKELLLREQQHRMKNTLTLVSSLLNVGARNIREPAQQAIFDDARDRILSIALIYEKLMRSSSHSRIAIQPYLGDLARSLARSYLRPEHEVDIEFSIADASIGTKQAISCGMIVNELLTNTFKYAFPDGSPGRVDISFHLRPAGHATLEVCDNGVGIPESVSWERPTTLGLQLVQMLAAQMRGALCVARRPTGGSSFQVTFQMD